MHQNNLNTSSSSHHNLSNLNNSHINFYNKDDIENKTPTEIYHDLLFIDDSLKLPSTKLLKIQQPLNLPDTLQNNTNTDTLNNNVNDSLNNINRLNNLNSICDFLEIPHFNTQRYHGLKNIYLAEFILLLDQRCSQLNIHLSKDLIDEVKDYFELLKKYHILENECEQLEVELENERDNHEKLKEINNTNIRKLERKLLNYRDKVCIKYNDIVKDILDDIKNNNIGDNKYFQNTKYYRYQYLKKIFNKMESKILGANILEKLNNITNLENLQNNTKNLTNENNLENNTENNLENNTENNVDSLINDKEYLKKLSQNILTYLVRTNKNNKNISISMIEDNLQVDRLYLVNGLNNLKNLGFINLNEDNSVNLKY